MLITIVIIIIYTSLSIYVYIIYIYTIYTIYTIYIYIYIYTHTRSPPSRTPEMYQMNNGAPFKYDARRNVRRDATANLCADILDFRGFDSSIILILRGGIPNKRNVHRWATNHVRVLPSFQQPAFQKLTKPQWLFYSHFKCFSCFEWYFEM